MTDIKQLVEDLEVGGDESYEDCARRLIELGYRIPDCPERWQADRMTGVVFGAASQMKTLRDIAIVMVNTAGVTKTKEL
jgi:hypothetical protein